jgi:superfamily II DNA or RNA helicase
MKLTKRTIINKPAVTYNLHIKNDHNYIANDAVVANCHTLKADVLKAMLAGPMAHIPLRWGLTGTIPKEKIDQITLKVTTGNVVGGVRAVDLQQKGILSNCFVHVQQLQDNREFGNYQTELKYLLSDGDRLDHIAEMISDISLKGNTLVLVDRIAAAGELALRLGEDVVVVTGNTKEDKRKEEYDSIRESVNKTIIATYGVAAVGINLPRLFNIVLIEPGKSFVRVIQSIGRGLRVAADKDHVDIWDITSNCKFAKRHLTKRKQFYSEAEYSYKIEKVKWKK